MSGTQAGRGGRMCSMRQEACAVRQFVWPVGWPAARPSSGTVRKEAVHVVVSQLGADGSPAPNDHRPSPIPNPRLIHHQNRGFLGASSLGPAASSCVCWFTRLIRGQPTRSDIRVYKYTESTHTIRMHMRVYEYTSTRIMRVNEYTSTRSQHTRHRMCEPAECTALTRRPGAHKHARAHARTQEARAHAHMHAQAVYCVPFS